MTHYSRDPENCRIDIFRESGKHYTTIQIRINGFDYNHSSTKEAVRKNLYEELGDNQYAGFLAVCLEPYHKNSHPVMFEIERSHKR